MSEHTPSRRARASPRQTSTPRRRSSDLDDGASHHVGVTLTPSGRYRARYKDKSLGTFDTVDEAVDVRAAYERERERGGGGGGGGDRVDEDEDDAATPTRGRGASASPRGAARTPRRAGRRSADAGETEPTRGGGGGARWTTQLALALFFVVVALAMAPPGGRTWTGARTALSPSPPPSVASAFRRPSCAAAAGADDAVVALAPARWEETVGMFMDAVRETSRLGRGGSGDETDDARASSSNAGGGAAGKGPSLMLVADGPNDARTVARDVKAAFDACDAEECVLLIDCEWYAASSAVGSASERAEQDARGALQKSLATFLTRCPRGVVVIQGAESLNRPLLSALLPALSEGGRFMRDGAEVRADLASYVVTVALGGRWTTTTTAGGGGGGGGESVRAWMEREWVEGRSVRAWMESERTFARRAKDALADVFAGKAGVHGGGGDEGGDDGVVGAFRRRVDFVVPSRLIEDGASSSSSSS